MVKLVFIVLAVLISYGYLQRHGAIRFYRSSVCTATAR